MFDDRTELLRTQAMQHVMSALGAAQVHVYGNEALAGGVFLHDDRTVSSITYWVMPLEDDTTDMGRYQYDVRVSVDVIRTAVPRGR